MQLMSCSEPDAVVERQVEVPVAPDAVWDELADILGDEVELDPEAGGRLHVREPGGELVGVVHEAVPGERLAFQWMRVEGDEPPSEVEITLAPSGTGTIVHVRETRLDAEHLIRSAFLASARA
jgi:uncharacterized protein YndB with AHSA1/START domain